MTKIIVVLLIALVLEAIGVVFLSHGLKQIGEMRQFNWPELSRLIARGATNPALLAGVMFEAIFFGALLYLLKRADVSLVWPLTSLGFVLTTLAARFIRHEEVNAWRWSGVVLIVIGAALVGYSETTKSPAAASAAASPAPSDPGR